jgi:hypothetical protein
MLIKKQLGSMQRFLSLMSYEINAYRVKSNL